VFSPAIYAVHVAVVDCDRELAAAMRSYAVELLFIANTFVPQGFLCPGADLDSRMVANQLVLLLFKELFVGFFDHMRERKVEGFLIVLHKIYKT
jgi:hypothetical protein